MTRTLQNNAALLLCLVLCTSLHAQFKNTAKLGPVNKSGFYSIAITPELSSYVKTDFSDLRVIDEEEKQAAYIIRKKSERVDSFTFRPLDITTKQQDDSGRTVIVIANNKKEEINSIVLLIGNASVSRKADISRSDDDKKWYSVVENISLERKYISDTDKYAETINLPVISYRHIRLIIYNGKNNPLNIIAAGRYTSFDYKTPVLTNTRNPASHFLQNDSADGYSYIRVNDTVAFHIDRVTLRVTGPKFFKRDVDIIVPYGTGANFTLSSNTVFGLEVPVFKGPEWLIKIYNGDNPPLKITSIETWQQVKWIVAWLDSGKTYHLEMNDAKATAPSYDLQAFKDSIPNNIQAISFSKIEAIAAAPVAPGNTILKQYWLWLVIAVILAGLIFFTIRLTKDLGMKKE